MPTTQDGWNPWAHNSVKRELTYGVGGTDIVVGEFALFWETYKRAARSDYQRLGGQGRPALSIDVLVKRVDRMLAIQPAELIYAKLSDEELLSLLDEPDGGAALFWSDAFRQRMFTWLHSGKPSKSKIDRVAKALKTKRTAAATRGRASEAAGIRQRR